MTKELVRLRATELLHAIKTQLGHAIAQESVLETSWVRLGVLLVEWKREEYWRDMGFSSLESSMVDLQTQYNRGRTQLWGYMSTTEVLLPQLPAATLEEIGISKAQELKRGVRLNDGAPLPTEIIDEARKKDTTVKKVRAAIGQALHTPHDDKGSWLDLNGFFVSTDERKEFHTAVKLTKQLLGIADSVPEHIQRREVILSWMREFIGTHGRDVYGVSVENIPPTLIGSENES